MYSSPFRSTSNPEQHATTSLVVNTIHLISTTRLTQYDKEGCIYVARLSRMHTRLWNRFWTSIQCQQQWAPFIYACSYFAKRAFWPTLRAPPPRSVRTWCGLPCTCCQVLLERSYSCISFTLLSCSAASRASLLVPALGADAAGAGERRRSMAFSTKLSLGFYSCTT